MSTRLLAVTLLISVAACAQPDAASVAEHEAAIPEVVEATAAPAPLPQEIEMPAAGFYALSTTTLEGEPAALSDYAGKVTLVVNVASACGYTPQYAGLQQLSEAMAERGLVVMGFPSNEFGGQEPGSPEQIRQFCDGSYGVTFPLMGKCEVKPGPGQSPVYAFLSAQTGSVPNWNFCKYLVGRDGQVIEFYASKVAPDDGSLRAAIEAALD